MFRKLFIEHPASVGETYGEHFVFALSFAGPLLVAGLGAALHAFIPALCQKTGSRTILDLHRRLTGNHGRGSTAEAEYMI